MIFGQASFLSVHVVGFLDSFTEFRSFRVYRRLGAQVEGCEEDFLVCSFFIGIQNSESRPKGLIRILKFHGFIMCAYVRLGGVLVVSILWVSPRAISGQQIEHKPRRCSGQQIGVSSTFVTGQRVRGKPESSYWLADQGFQSQVVI